MKAFKLRLRGRSGDPGGADVRQLREQGRAAYERGDHEAALRDFEAAARAAPRSAMPWVWIARTQLRLADRPAAYRAVEQALELEPDEPDAAWLMGRLLEEDGRLDECRDLVVRLGHGHANDRGVLRRGVTTLVRIGAPDEAAELADALLALDRADPVGLAAKGVALERSGQRAEALALVGRAGASAPGGSSQAPSRGPQAAPQRHEADPHGHEAAALFDLWSGRPLDAWHTIEPDPASPSSVDTLVEIGLALRRAGHLASALDAFRRALEGSPGETTARRWADATEGELVVLAGSWRPPAPAVVRHEAVKGRVLHLVTRALPDVQDGYTLRTSYIVAAQEGLGLEPRVFSQLAGVDAAHGRRRAREGSGPARLDDRLDATFERLARVVEASRPAVLHAASDFRNGLLALRLREATGIPVVYEVRGFWEESWLTRGERDTTSDSYRWRQERETACMRDADAVVTLSRGMAGEIAGRGVDPGKVTIVPNGVDVERFVPVARDPGLAKRWGIEPTDVTLGYVSTLSPYEGIEYLLRATATLIGRGRPVRAVIVGEGEESAALRQLAARLGIAERVAFCGRVPHDQVLAHYGLIDIFVVPRTNDRVSHLVTPLKPLEAMATGRAVIVSGVEALAAMVQEGVTGEVFRPEDADDLAEVAGRLVEDAERRAALGRAAREWVVRERSWSRLASTYLEVYRVLGALS